VSLLLAKSSGDVPMSMLRGRRSRRDFPSLLGPEVRRSKCSGCRGMCWMWHGSVRGNPRSFGELSQWLRGAPPPSAGTGHTAWALASLCCRPREQDNFAWHLRFLLGRIPKPSIILPSHCACSLIPERLRPIQSPVSEFSPDKVREEDTGALSRFILPTTWAKKSQG